MSYLLAIDTSTRHAGIALAGEGRIFEHTWLTEYNHGAELLAGIERLLEKAGASFGDVGRIAVAIGPGGFSSLRVGVSTAKGLAMPRRLPLAGVSTYDLEVAPVWPAASPLVAVIDAGSSGVAWAEYRAPEGGGENPFPASFRGAGGVSAPEELLRLAPPAAVFCGEGAGRLAGYVSSDRIANGEPPTRRPTDLAAIAEARFAAGDLDDPARLTPEYAREPSVTRAAR